MSGIVTVTLAPAVDLTYRIDRIEPGQVNRASSFTSELSGKGVNVSHAVHASGVATRAVLPLAADERPGEAPWLRPVPARGATRQNVTIATGDGVTTKLNAPATPLSRSELDALLQTAIEQAQDLGADWVVLAGTVPPLEGGETADLGAAVAALGGAGLRVAVDTSGAPLALLLSEHAGQIALVKPNTRELAEATGRPLRMLGDVAEAASELVSRGIETVYVSMGEDGALGVSADGVWWARAAAPAVVNATGAGDASLAGFLVRAGSGRPDIPAAIAGAASYGALAVSQPGTLLHDPAAAPRATVVSDPDPAILLRDPAV